MCKFCMAEMLRILMSHTDDRAKGIEARLDILLAELLRYLKYLVEKDN